MGGGKRDAIGQGGVGGEDAIDRVRLRSWQQRWRRACGRRVKAERSSLMIT